VREVKWFLVVVVVVVVGGTAEVEAWEGVRQEDGAEGWRSGEPGHTVRGAAGLGEGACG
jgi:hypothetical protein